jgi:hypothetical protein
MTVVTQSLEGEGQGEKWDTKPPLMLVFLSLIQDFVKITKGTYQQGNESFFFPMRSVG